MSDPRLKPVKLEGQLTAVYEDEDGNVVGEEIFSLRVYTPQFGELSELVAKALAEHQA